MYICLRNANKRRCVVCVVVMCEDADKARKHGLDEFVQATPSQFDHHMFFTLLQRLTLDFRLSDQFTCLVRTVVVCSVPAY